MASQAVNIDDYDTNDIDYQNPSLWNHQLGQQNVQGGTYTAGYTNAVAKFTFSGTEVMVFGVATPPPSNNSRSLTPSVSFSVDGRASNEVSNPTVKTAQYSYHFFDSGTLSPGQHTLQILVNNGAQDWPFVLDYIQYIPLRPTTSSTSSRHPTGALTFAPTGTADTPPEVAVTHSKKSTPVGAIVGAVIAGLVGLGLLAFAVWFYVFRLRKRGLHTYHGATKVDLVEPEYKPHVPSIGPSTTAVESSYMGDADPYRGPSLGAESIYAPTEPSRAFSSDLISRPSSPSMSYDRPATPPAAFHTPAMPPTIASRPGTPPTVFHPAVLNAPGATVPAVPSPLGKAARADGNSASARSAGPVMVFHADSGIRFAPPAPAPTSGHDVEGATIADGHSDVAVSEVPPEYTES